MIREPSRSGASPAAPAQGSTAIDGGTAGGPAIHPLPGPPAQASWPEAQAIDPLADPETSPALTPFSLFLVEDNPGDIRLVREVLAGLDAPPRLTVAQDGLDALALLQRSSRLPDLVLLDLNLPGLDGRSLLRRLKGDPVTRRVPVLVFTNSSAPQDVRAAYDLHANGYLVKPTDFSGYERLLRETLDFWMDLVQRPGR